MSVEREIIIRMINTYKNMTFLWNKSHKDYKNKKKRDEGHNILLEIYKELDPDACLKTSKKKIENMKTSYIKELKKVIESQRKGDKVYVPTLFYFEALQFYGEHHCEELVTRRDSIEAEGPLSQLSSDAESDYQKPSVSSTQKKKRTLSSIEIQEVESRSTEDFKYTGDGKWEAIGRALGLQLRDLEKPQRIVAQKLINDVMYYAESGLLNPQCSISLVPSVLQSANMTVQGSSPVDSKELILSIDDPLGK